MCQCAIPWSDMTPRLLCLVFVLGLSFGEAQAQVRIIPYAAAALGVSDLRTRIRIQTSPPSVNFAATHSNNLLAAVNLGLGIGHHFAVDAGLRSTVGIRQPFRVLSFGPAVRWGQRAQVQLRAGLGRVQGFQEVICVASSSRCPRYDSEWANGFDLSAGLSFRSGARWSIGPDVWWAQSTGGGTQYGSLGLGAHVRYQ